jgi:beta-glucanase (GH16 family)
MKWIIIFLTGCLFFHIIVLAQTPANDPHWQLKWEDNFNFFDNTKWTKTYGIDDGQPQLYLENQVWTSNGYLVIELNNSSIVCPPPPPPPPAIICPPCVAGKLYKYRSGDIHSKSAYNTKFGYIEAKIKFPYEAGKQWGFFPAFWTVVGEEVTNQANVAEIDICEVFGKDDNPNKYNIGVVRVYENKEKGIKKDGYGSDGTTGPPFLSFSYADWHTYAVEWDKDRIIWYCDGQVVHSLAGHAIIDPVRIILNLAVAGEPQYQPRTTPPFTAQMLVDYVKVYNLKFDKSTVVNEISNFNTYNYAVKKSITLSGATTIPAGSNISLRATDFIELKAGFEVPTGRELYLDITGIEVVNVVYGRR